MSNLDFTQTKKLLNAFLKTLDYTNVKKNKQDVKRLKAVQLPHRALFWVIHPSQMLMEFTIHTLNPL